MQPPPDLRHQQVLHPHAPLHPDVIASKSDSAESTVSSSADTRGIYAIETDPPYFHYNSLCKFRAPSIDFDCRSIEETNEQDCHAHDSENVQTIATKDHCYRSLANDNIRRRRLLTPCPSNRVRLESPLLPQSPPLPPKSVKEINRSLNLWLDFLFDPRKVGTIWRICKVASDLLGLVEGPFFSPDVPSISPSTVFYSPTAPPYTEILPKNTTLSPPSSIGVASSPPQYEG